ncbi:MAG: ATP-binding protein [Chloroflexota bacterium]|nr:sensor histidine kinase [Anaerolineae bacterium]HMM30017.1 ATP-binding protein [Aggregatilineaceae bacterium]
MTPRRWLGLLLPAGLALAGVMLVVRVSYVRGILVYPDDLDVLVIIPGLILAIIAALMLILTLALDYRHQRRIERLRQAALAERFRFLRRLDHQLKNPLTALHAGLGSLALTLQDEGQRQTVQMLEQEAHRLSRLIFSLRKLTDLETVPIELEPLDIAEFLREAVDLERERSEFAERRFAARLPPEPLPRVPADQDLLLLALHNLLDNAFKFTGPGDSITLSARVDEDDLLIQVRDTGVGIPADDLPLVGEELYRGRNTENVPGDGIGLAVVSAIVAHHGGALRLDSALGQGTSVTLRLPVR